MIYLKTLIVITIDYLVKTKEIKKIHKKFCKLDNDKKGYVNIDDLIKIPEIEKNPLRFYICQYLSNQNKNEEINFELFIKLIDIFKNNKIEDQYKCKLILIKVLFELFDFNKDGKICYEDLLLNLKLLIGNSLNEEQLKEIVDKTIQEYSGDQKFITFDEFIKILDS